MARGRTSSLRIVLSAEARPTLAHWQRSTTLAARLVRRGKRLLLVAVGHAHSDVAPGCWRPTHPRADRGQMVSGPAAGWPHRRSWPRCPGRGSPRRSPSTCYAWPVNAPDRLGRRLSQWDGAARARQLVADRIVAELSAATGRRILAGPQLTPWRHHLQQAHPVTWSTTSVATAMAGAPALAAYYLDTSS
jgi:hypothetical protein